MRKLPAKDDCACLLEWLTRGEEGDNVAMIIPYAILPVVAALKSIHSLDPYLSTHYLQQLKPLLPIIHTFATRDLQAKAYPE